MNIKRILNSKETSKWWEVTIAICVLTLSFIFTPKIMKGLDSGIYIGISMFFGFFILIGLRILRINKMDK